MSATSKESAPGTGSGTEGKALTSCRQSTANTVGNQGVTPPPVDGIHSWIMSAAWECRKLGMNAGSAIETILGYEGRLRRPLQPREVEDAVEKVFSTTVATRPDQIQKAPLPDWNRKETERLHRQFSATVDTLRELSPVDDPGEIPSSAILKRLFPDPETLLCIGRSSYSFKTATLADHGDLSRHQLVVPAPMLSVWGTTATGKQSMHTKEQTGPRAFIVCDFDEPPPEEHPSIIMQLSRFRRPLLVLTSGGKSLHAWFPTTTSTEDDRLFWRSCIALGADPAIYRNPSQFVRLPNGTRDNGNHQEVLFLNLDTIQS